MNRKDLVVLTKKEMCLHLLKNFLNCQKKSQIG